MQASVDVGLKDHHIKGGEGHLNNSEPERLAHQKFQRVSPAPQAMTAGQQISQIPSLRPIPSGKEWSHTQSFQEDYKMSGKVIRRFIRWGYV
jgi:hypothetical protein